MLLLIDQCDPDITHDTEVYPVTSVRRSVDLTLIPARVRDLSVLKQYHWSVVLVMMFILVVIMVMIMMVMMGVTTHSDAETPALVSRRGLHSHSLVSSEHELTHGQETRVRHAAQPHPGHLTSHNVMFTDTTVSSEVSYRLPVCMVNDTMKISSVTS